MKANLILSVLGALCLLSSVKSACDLKNKKDDVDFPDIMKDVAESYIMNVEYSVPGAKQTDYYTEYYGNAFGEGRVDSHIDGENKKYIYKVETWESWTLENDKCSIQNITDTADFFKDGQTDWLYYGGQESPKTIGPSAMFRNAYDVWNAGKREGKIAYMGIADKLIRGEEAVFWRRCMGNYYADYFFADESEENPDDSDAFSKKVTPLRVAFYNISDMEQPLANQFYDIMSFKHYIPAGMEPFQLPKGKSCKRGPLVDGPALPDFSDKDVFMYAEVVFKKYNNEDELMSSYYSTLMFSIDRGINHMAYYYSAWNTTKPVKKEGDQDPFVDSPKYVVYDMTHNYVYKINQETGKCEILREKPFIPYYQLPDDGDSIALTDPYVLLPNNELTFLSELTNRGMTVNIYEAEIENYKLQKGTLIKKAIISHSYFQSNEKVENTVEVKNAPTQMELRFFRGDGANEIKEVLTFNVFGFSTRIPNKQMFFDVTRCFKNADDYLYVTVGFEIENRYLPNVENSLSDIEENVVTAISVKSELNRVRMPKVMTDLKKNYVFVTVVIIDRPSYQTDFMDTEPDKNIVSGVDDTQGVSDFATCAQNCLETRSDCWGFSMCGATCSYGSAKNTNVETKKDCTLYRRFSNESYMWSKEKQAENIAAQVEAGEFNIMVILDNGERVTLTATTAQIKIPAEDDSLFRKMGNLLNPRMRVLKAGAKLKQGSTVKNLGKLGYDECQSLCLDFKSCETVSYCLKSSECIISSKFGSDLKDEEMVKDDMCNLLTRKYADNFDRTPGVFVTIKGGTKLEINNVEDCAKACLKQESFKCLSFDHCAGGEKQGCTLYNVHYLNPKARVEVQEKNPRCGHYTRKFSTEFQRKDETVIVGSSLPPLMNLTLEECAKTCVEYDKGACFGYDFCQDKEMYATSCTLLDSDPSRLKSTYSAVCTNYIRSGVDYAPHPYTTSYAGGIGFLCFLIGGVLGAVVVFVVAYIRVNKR